MCGLLLENLVHIWNNDVFVVLTNGFATVCAEISRFYPQERCLLPCQLS